MGPTKGSKSGGVFSSVKNSLAVCPGDPPASGQMMIIFCWWRIQRMGDVLMIFSFKLFDLIRKLFILVEAIVDIDDNGEWWYFLLNHLIFRKLAAEEQFPWKVFFHKMKKQKIQDLKYLRKQSILDYWLFWNYEQNIKAKFSSLNK